MNQTVLITGASQGLGRELAIKLTAQNYTVIGLARDESKLKHLAQTIKPKNKFDYFVCDIRDRNQVAQTIKHIIDKHGQLDILLNNAGVWTEDSLQLETPELLDNAIHTNLLGQIYVTEAILPYFKQKNAGKIFTVISTAGVLGIPAGDNTNWKTYGASKWGLTGYTQALKESLRDTKIQVTQFFPGGFESNLYQNAGRSNAHNQPWMMKTTDVADCIVFALTRPADVYVEQMVISKMM